MHQKYMQSILQIVYSKLFFSYLQIDQIQIFVQVLLVSIQWNFAQLQLFFLRFEPSWLQSMNAKHLTLFQSERQSLSKNIAIYQSNCFLLSNLSINCKPSRTLFSRGSLKWSIPWTIDGQIMSPVTSWYHRADPGTDSASMLFDVTVVAAPTALLSKFKFCFLGEPHFLHEYNDNNVISKRINWHWFHRFHYNG